MDVLPTSTSLILRASHILVIQIQTSTPGPWRGDEETGEYRDVHLGLSVIEIVKGTTTAKVGDVVEIDVVQPKPAFTLRQLPGVWRNATLDVGTRYVSFSASSSEDAKGLFQEPTLTSLLPPDQALADVHIAAKADKDGLDLTGTLALVKPFEPVIRDLFVDYLVATFGAQARSDIGRWKELCAFLEDPPLHIVARTALLMALSRAAAVPPPSNERADRLAVSLFHLLAMPEAAAQHDNLVSTYLPNLLDVANPHCRTPGEVFHDYPGEKQKALAAVNGYHGSDNVAPLLDWLHQ